MLRVLRQRNFGLLFAGQLVSQMGDWVLFVALPYWIYQLTGSATQTGVMFLALYLPRLALAPIAGVYADRWNRKTTMIATDLGRGCVMLTFFLVRSPGQAWLIYLLAFAESCFSRFFFPAESAVLPMLVSAEDLTPMNAAVGSGQAAARLGGPALGGVLVAVWGPHGATSFDAASYFISALAIALIAVPSISLSRPATSGVGAALLAVWRELVTGLRIVSERRALKVLFASMAILQLSEGVFSVLMIVLVETVWHGGAKEFGWFLSVQGFGALAGGPVIAMVGGRVSSRLLLSAGTAAIGLLLLMVVNQPSFIVSLGLIALAGVAVVALQIGANTILQRATDDDNRGRVSSLLTTAMAASIMLSISVTTALASHIGVVHMFDGAGCIDLLAGATALLIPTGALLMPALKEEGRAGAV